MVQQATSKTTIRSRRLFWTQYTVGIVAGIIVLIVLATAGRTRLWSPVGVVLVIVVATMVLRALERRRPGVRDGYEDASQWARHVRELRASRLEIVTAFEIERRRIERDLHDGAQQHLVAASLKLGEAAYLLGVEDSDVRQVASLLGEAQDATESSLSALRATVSGIHPTVLSDLGLHAAVVDLADHSALDVTIRCPHVLPPAPAPVAAAAYFLVSEALTNIAKHAPQASATVLLAADEHLHVSIVDNGPGGAHMQPGHGLSGLSERLDAFGGSLMVTSPTGGPTTLKARLPLLLETGQSGISADSRMEGPRCD